MYTKLKPFHLLSRSISVFFVITALMIATIPTDGMHAQLLSSIQSIAWSSDGKQIATGHQDGTVRVWNTATGQIIHTLQGHGCEVTSLAWKADGSQLISGDFDINHDCEITARVWDTETGEPLATLSDISSTSILGVSWSLDSTQIITFGFDVNPNLKFWDAVTYQLISEENKGGDAFQIVWRPDHTLVALANTVGKIILADPVTIDPIIRLEESMASEGAVGGVYAVAWSPDGRLVAGGNTAGIVRVWDVANGQNLMNLEGADSQGQSWITTAIRAVHFSPDGFQIASIAADGTLRTWDVKTEAIVSTKQLAGTPLYAAAWSPGGTHLAYGGERGALEIMLAVVGCGSVGNSHHRVGSPHATNAAPWARWAMWTRVRTCQTGQDGGAQQLLNGQDMVREPQGHRRCARDSDGFRLE